MGFYYADDRPPEKPPGWKKFIPGWLKSFWSGTEEVLVISQVAFSLIFPVIGAMVGFVLVCFLLFFIANQCSGGGSR